MSINHFSSDLPETQWWSSANITSSTHQQQDPSRPHPSSRDHFLTPQFYQDPHHHHNYPRWLINSQQEPTSMPSNFHTQNTPTPTLNFNLNQNDAADDDLSDRAYQFQHESKHLDDADDDKEPMFEKPLTPSDVGKLNRLVIPKQHAEKYFPLGGGDSGLLLSFEDESGKSWRFRYSYWNSSQSYVLTKGWSRYVKEKRLDAGDVVLFERRRAHTDRLFIGWRRRSAPAHDSMSGPSAPAQARGGGGGEMSGSSGTSGSGAGAGGWTRMFYSAPHQYSSYPAHQYHHSVAPYPPDCLHAAGSSGQNSQTTTVGNSKILRLFGVNLECQEHQQLQHEGDESSEPSTPDGSSSMSMSSQQQLYPAARAYNYADNGDLTFSRDVNPMRNRRG